MDQEVLNERHIGVVYWFSTRLNIFNTKWFSKNDKVFEAFIVVLS